jgi:hypothetical protein
MHATAVSVPRSMHVVHVVYVVHSSAPQRQVLSATRTPHSMHVVPCQATRTPHSMHVVPCQATRSMQVCSLCTQSCAALMRTL